MDNEFGGQFTAEVASEERSVEMIYPWIFEFFHAAPSAERADKAAVKRRFDDYLDMWTRDEALGFEGVIFSEHHFGPGYSPSPNLLIAAMASRTSKMRLGMLGVSTAYVTPLRIVEEAAMLDNLTDGRLEFGMVRGIPQELALLGMSIPDGDARFDATLRAVNAAFASADDEFQCDGLVIEPPLRQANMPKWLAITSDRSARRAASLGWKACSGFLSLERITAAFDGYREEAGLDYAQAADMLGIRRFVTFVDSPAQVTETKAKMWEFRVADLKNGPRVSETGHSSAPGSGPAILDIDAAIKAIMSEDEFIIGTPADVADEIIHQCRTVGSAHFMVNLHSSYAVADMSREHRIFGEEVVPILRKADLKLGSEKAA